MTTRRKPTTKVVPTPDIAGIREMLGLTTPDMARQLHVSAVTIERWETGRTRPSRVSVNNIGDMLARGLADVGR